jgi:hypothetical protein
MTEFDLAKESWGGSACRDLLMAYRICARDNDIRSLIVSRDGLKKACEAFAFRYERALGRGLD